MKQIILFLTFASVALFSGCKSAPVTEPAPIASPSTRKPADPAALEKIKTFAAGSKCAKYSWKERGVAKAGYMKGMATSFVKSLCSPIPTISAAPGVAGDALTQYADIFKNLGMKNSEGLEAHRHTWVLLLGLGMRESSGQYCSGRDMQPAALKQFHEADEMEAGLFQTSYNIVSYKAESKKIYQAYKADQSKCLLDVYKEGISQSYCDKNAKNYGEGEGLNYQALAKKCPALATETAAITIRFSGGPKGHYGPLREKAAEVIPACDDMFLEIEKMVIADMSVCGSI